MHIFGTKWCIVAVYKIRKIIYRSDVEATFELRGHFRCLQVLYSKWNYIYNALSYSVDYRAPPGKSSWALLVKMFFFRCIPENTFDEKWTLVQVTARYRQVTSHYLNHSRPRFMSPYGVTRPQCVKLKKMLLSSSRCLSNFRSIAKV